MRNKIILIACALFAGMAVSLPMQNALGEDMHTSVQIKDTPFGVLEFLHWSDLWNHNKYSDPKDLEKCAQLMQEAGVSIVRMDFLWGDIERSPGMFDFQKYDTIVEVLARHHIQLLGLLDYSAGWASRNGQWNGAPRDDKQFAAYACAVAKRYKGKVKYWEIWNEPDSPTYWEPQDGLKEYCALLKKTYVAIKKVDPGCLVLNGGLAQGITSVNKLYDNGAQDYFDILNIHIFEQPVDFEAIHRVEAYPRLAYKIMQRHNDANKQIWVTEIGCPGVPKGGTVANWWMGPNPGEDLQASWVKEAYAALLKAPHVQKIFWAFFRDTQEHWNNGVDYFGLVRWDFSKKPGFESYRKVVESWNKEQGY